MAGLAPGRPPCTCEMGGPACSVRAVLPDDDAMTSGTGQPITIRSRRPAISVIHPLSACPTAATCRSAAVRTTEASHPLRARRHSPVANQRERRGNACVNLMQGAHPNRVGRFIQCGGCLNLPQATPANLPEAWSSRRRSTPGRPRQAPASSQGSSRRNRC